MRRHTVALVASLVVAARVAGAEDSGPTLYLGTGFSVAGEQDTRINDPTKPAPPPSVPQLAGVDFDLGYQDAALAEVGLGYRLMRYLRVEANVSYRQHTVDNVKYRPGRGDVHLIAGMANVYADYPLGAGGEAGEVPLLVPYAGVGLGVLWSKPRAEIGLPDRKLRGESSELAWNVMLGAAIPITRHVALDLGYRYLESLDHRWLLRSGANGVGDVDTAYQTHEGRAGLRIEF